MNTELVGIGLLGGSIGYFTGKYVLAPYMRKHEVWPYG